MGGHKSVKLLKSSLLPSKKIPLKRLAKENRKPLKAHERNADKRAEDENHSGAEQRSASCGTPGSVSANPYASRARTLIR
jgi:hypothetical protein